MAFQNSFVDNLTGFMDKGEFQSAGSNSLMNMVSETTCSRHACCDGQRSFEATDPFSETCYPQGLTSQISVRP